MKEAELQTLQQAKDEPYVLNPSSDLLDQFKSTEIEEGDSSSSEDDRSYFDPPIDLYTSDRQGF